MNLRPSVVGLICVVAGVFLILLFFKKRQAPLASALLSARKAKDAVEAASQQGGVGERYRFSRI